ncbi:hypothetical protein ACFV9C_38470 [Kribbella sp. NPDC059898]|uniref:hypothetical protein n=1 Tax=Kribbella sp. NPDC059898 TaxID=3346995 RepID=UPI00366855C8
MRKIGAKRDKTRRVPRSIAHRLQTVAAGGGLLICFTAAVFLALTGSSRLLLLGVSLCTAIALFEVAVIVTTRIKP